MRGRVVLNNNADNLHLLICIQKRVYVQYYIGSHKLVAAKFMTHYIQVMIRPKFGVIEL